MKYIYILVTALTYIQLSHGILFFFYFFEIFILVTALTYIHCFMEYSFFFLLFLELKGEQLATERQEAPVGDNDEDDEDGKRGATWKMLKNQGLKAHKKVKQRREKEVIFLCSVVLFFVSVFSFAFLTTYLFFFLFVFSSSCYIISAC